MPLTPQARTGLLAVAIVGGGTLLLGCVIGVVLLSGGSKDTRPGTQADGRADSGKGTGKGDGNKGLADRPVSTGNEKDDESYILGHRWWKKPPTRKQLDEMVKLIVEQNKSTGNTENCVAINQAGDFVKSHVLVQGSYHYYGPEAHKLGEKRINYICSDTTRPTRESVLRWMCREIDSREYKDGPGR